MGKVLPPYDLTVEPLVQVELTLSSRYGTATHPFDLFWIRRRVGPKSLDAYSHPILLAHPNIRESTRNERNCVA